MNEEIKCAICGAGHAQYQPPGGLAAWLNDAYTHEDDLDDASRLMYELCMGLITGDEELAFWTSDLDRTKTQLNSQGWKVMCDECAQRPQ